MKSLSGLGGLVYSTEAGRMCPGCRQPVAQCVCSASLVRPKGDGIARVGRESKGRGGKTVTLVRGLALDDAALVQLGKQIKAACGSGGTVKEGVIEVQGDHADKVVELLRQRGYTARRTGG